MENKIQIIVISSKDRFIRFGCDWFEKLCQKFNTRIIVVNNGSLSPNEEFGAGYDIYLIWIKVIQETDKGGQGNTEELKNGNQPNSGTNTENQ